VRTVNIAAALVFLALSVITAIGTRELAYWTDFAPGPAFAPVWIAAAGALLSLLLLAREMRNPSKERADLPEQTGWVRVLVTVAALTAALVLAPAFGLVPSVALLTLFVLLAVERRRLLPSLVVTVLTTALVHGVFVAWLNVALPKGPLGL
jgi:putative tricarboxylic transport membrane protein